MSYTEFKQVNEKLVDKILEQGQRLRNAMVQSILQNDPLSSEIIYNKHYTTPVSSTNTLLEEKSGNKKLLEAFLNGDFLTKDEEETALNTMRTMSVTDVCKTTEKTLSSKCFCSTCSAYHQNNLKCDLRRTKCDKEKCISNKITPSIKQNNSDYSHIIKYADSLKIILQSIHLNNLGNKKVSCNATKKHCNFGIGETYFVEYCIPKIFTDDMSRRKSKIDSGLDSNHVRVCARKSNEVIYIRQIFIHSVNNLYESNLEDYDISFFVRYKSRGQKCSLLLGVAKFKLAQLKSSRNFSCCKTLPIHLNEESPIVIGTIKVTLQLGCGKIYFGQEFVDAVVSQKLPSDNTDSDEEYKVIEANLKRNPTNDIAVQEKNLEGYNKLNRAVIGTDQNIVVPPPVVSKSDHLSKIKNLTATHFVEKLNRVPNLDLNIQKELLFGFIYISEAQFLNVCPNSYILCQPFCQSDTSSSKVVYNSTNPLYNFCQTVPLLYEDDILLKLRENFTIIEFWEKRDQTDLLFGLTRLPLHQFYLAYRNAVILQHLKRNKLPIIGTDWWEPIYSSDNNELIGQVQVLTALGTEDQIRNLEIERGFKDDIVKAKFPSTTQVRASVRATPRSSSYFRDQAKVVSKQVKPLKSPVGSGSDRKPVKDLKPPEKVDVGVQSDIEVRMESKDDSQKVPQMQDMLSSFMKLLEQRPVRMENSTNTDAETTAMTSGPSTHFTQIQQNIDARVPQIRKTSDLLDSLQQVLSLDGQPVRKIEKPQSVRFQIAINGANQLPGRRKIKSKSKRIKGKSPKQEENMLPSTYVTFETMPGQSLQITNVFSKSTSPQWNYKCEVGLPKTLLTNGQKRLIFKVWKKSTNAVLQPNMMTDLVLGFAAVDLSVLLAGLPNIQGWFNIIDFSGKCNGQINIHVNPLENLEKLIISSKNILVGGDLETTLKQQLPEKEEGDELLSRALKRKFTELDEITQRLRLRLSEVVSEDSDGSNDEIAEEFENDINNLCVEEDFDLINFEEEARKLNANYSSQKLEAQSEKDTSHLLSVGSESEVSTQSAGEKQNGGSKHQQVKVDGQLQCDVSELSNNDPLSDNTESSSSKSSFMDKHIIQGKQRIDSLLEKLSLINAEVNQPFSSRYVSGCSVSNETTDAQEILKDLDEHSRPNIRAGTSFDSLMFQPIYEGAKSLSSQNSGKLNSNLSSNSNSNSNVDGAPSGSSGTSVITSFSDCRPNPDGQGTSTDDKGT